MMGLVNAAAFLPRQHQEIHRDTNPGVISAPLWRRDETRSVENDIRRREQLSKRQTTGTVNLNLRNTANKLLYFANRTPCHIEEMLI